MAQDDKRPKAERTMMKRILDDATRAWNGNERLSTVFWRHGVMTSAVLIVVYAGTVMMRQPAAEQVLLLLCLPYTAWIVVSIWRCSLATGTIWGVLARFLTIAWAANVFLILLFRQLDLLVLFAGNPATIMQ